MGGIVSGIGSAVGGILGGIGANKAAKQQQKSLDKQMDWQRDLMNRQDEWLSPFREAGTGALPDLIALAGQPIDREKTLQQYYGGNEYKMAEGAARNSLLASAEATGNLGSSATANSLTTIAPTLGQNYLAQMTAQQQDMYNQLMGLANVGLSGAGAQSAAAAQGTNALNALQGQKGNVNAAKAALPWQVAGYTQNALNQGAAQDLNNGASWASNLFGSFI